ncbi:hypothetical protein V2J09_011876 [Rumex salicifolius]
MPTRRRLVWDELHGIISRVKEPIMNWVNRLNLIDLGFTRATFTWARGEDTNRYVAKRLDRVFMCSTARTQWAEASVFHLTKVGSDHAPLLLTLESHNRNRGRRRAFKFKAAWTSHPQFKDFIRSKWKHETATNGALVELKEDLQDWNHSVFDNIYQRKRKLMAKLEGIQKSFSRGVSSNLLRLEAQLKEELNTVLLQEETLWLQKSREEWLASRDRNTSFFHLSTVIKRKRNKIKGLKDATNELVTDNTCMEAMALSFFGSPYTLSEAENVPNTGMTSNGEFSIASAYSIAATSEPIAWNDTSFFNSVEKLKVPERIRTFVWLMAHGILTNEERRRRHLTDVALCPICKRETESLAHLFRDCL